MDYWQKTFSMENAVAVKSKKKNKVMGDDPLLWIKEDIGQTNVTTSKTRQSQKTSKQAEKGKARSKQTKKVSDPASDHDEQIVLAPVLAIENAKDLYEQFNSIIQKRRNVIINASSVEMIDTAMLQLLIAFVRKLQNQGIKISWIEPSDELISRAVLLNLEEHLNID